MKQRLNIEKINQTIQKMKNEITRLKRNGNYNPNPRIPIPEQRINPIHEQRARNNGIDDKKKTESQGNQIQMQ
jgi:hypothetical protein